MIKLTREQIKEVADQFDCGFRCYYNKETKEITSVIDTDRHPFAEEEMWEDAFEEIDENRDKLIEIEPPDTRDSFRFMENFIDTVEDKEIRNRLVYALNRPKPFSNFKYEIDYSGIYREKWFKFKMDQLIGYVKVQVEMLNNLEISDTED